MYKLFVLSACKITTNIWNKQGIVKKNQIYLNFVTQGLVIRTTVRLEFRREPFGACRNYITKNI